MIAAIYFQGVTERVARTGSKYFDCNAFFFVQPDTATLDSAPEFVGEVRCEKAKVWSSAAEEYGEPIQGRVCMAACREEEFRGEKQLIITAYVWQADTFPVEKFQPDLSGMPF